MPERIWVRLQSEINVGSNPTRRSKFKNYGGRRLMVRTADYQRIMAAERNIVSGKAVNLVLMGAGPISRPKSSSYLE